MHITCLGVMHFQLLNTEFLIRTYISYTSILISDVDDHDQDNKLYIVVKDTL